MRYEIVLAPEAIGDLRALPAHRRATVRDALEKHLRHDPARTSRSRIKRLASMASPEYRLRVGDVRIYYDIASRQVIELAIVSKATSGEWLARFGEPDETSGPG